MDISYDVYQQISERTNGDIYIGVVGPVRTGKSTFIKRFMELMVLPRIDDHYKKERMIDELPQSASGKTIMTTEPKFIPNEAVKIELQNSTTFKVRLVDCVGYMIPDALGDMEGEYPRMVSTPWFDQQIPFEEAAETGTKKVITEHSSIGIVITTDGSITNIDRDNYLEAEDRVINELEQLSKPYVIILNTTNPNSQEALTAKHDLQQKYKKPVIIIDCVNMSNDDLTQIAERLLYEFPVCETVIKLPDWYKALEKEHWLLKSLIESCEECFNNITNIRNVIESINVLNVNVNINSVGVENIDLGNGSIVIDTEIPESVFYKILHEKTNLKIDNKKDLLENICNLAEKEQKLQKYEKAIEQVNETGYGVVTPQISELVLENPEIIKQGSRFGVRLKAGAPSIHMLRADIETELAPMVGSEKQSEELIEYLMKEFEGEPEKLWESNLFGKSLYELVTEGLNNKLYRLPDESRNKLRETLQKIINEGTNGLICIIF